MNDALNIVLGQSRDLFWSYALVFLRIGPIVFFLPALGEQMIPVRIRLAISLSLTAIVTPLVLPLSWNNDVPAFGLALSETAIGLAYGVSLRLMTHALLIAGTIAGQATSLAQLFGGTAAEAQPAIANFIYMAGLALLMMTDMHIYLIEALARSYTAFPPGFILQPSDVATWGVGLVSSVFALGFTLSAAFVLASTLYNVAIGVVNRAMPQLMVSFVGAPAITAGGLLLTMLVLPVLLPVWKGHFDDILMMPLGAVR